MQKTVYVEGTAALPLHITDVSPIADLMRHPMGAVIVQQIMDRPDSPLNDSAENLGEGSDRMMENMIRELPLGALLSFDYVTREELHRLLDAVRE